MGVMSIKIFLVIKRHFFRVFHIKVSRNQQKKKTIAGYRQLYVNFIINYIKIYILFALEKFEYFEKNAQNRLIEKTLGVR